MEIATSNIIKSDAGRDSGKLFVVTSTDGEYLWLVDGKSRKVEQPKRKKRKHVAFVAEGTTRLAQKIQHGEHITNSEVRRALAEFREDIQMDQEG
ncbi:KOW domain-containing RNA-binding protein [Bengtsoniella intestinalis]|uniref:hypothetical protein n=1 Tax=Bengtsoniella intestinalis TaxID=3073143 RepID=UPI00391F3381